MENQVPEPSQHEIDSIACHDSTEFYTNRFPEIKYKAVVIRDNKHRREIAKQWDIRKGNKVGYKALVTLNRKEINQIRKGETILIPDSVMDQKAYSCFPQYYCGAKDIPKIVMVSTLYLSYACYEYGKLVRFAATNTGKERTPTYPGRYALEWKKKEHRSSLDSNWVMPFTINFHHEAGNAFHKFTMPGYAASHSCCRQFMDDAEWLFYWGKGFRIDSNRKRIAKSGTPVIILDVFDYKKKKKGPWLDIRSNKDIVVDLPADPMAVEEALIPWCQIPDGAKGRIKNKNRFRYGEDTLRARGIIREGVNLIVTRNFNDERRKKEAAEKRKKAEEEKLKAEEEQKSDLEKEMEALEEKLQEAPKPDSIPREDIN
jgi:L,D-transpeptidase-like protein